jgi:hypothetical protein
MSQFAMICPHCSAELVLPARKLVLHVEDAAASSGEVIFPCLWCDRTAVATLEGSALASVRDGGVTTLALTTYQEGYGVVSDQTSRDSTGR